MQRDTAVARDYLDPLARELEEIADILKTVYASLDPDVHIAAYKNPESTYLVYCKELIRDEDYDPDKAEELDMDDIVRTANWTVHLTAEEQFEVAIRRGEGDPIEIENFPLTEGGYQNMLAYMVKDMARYFPPEVKLAYFHEDARRKNQIALNLC